MNTDRISIGVAIVVIFSLQTTAFAQGDFFWSGAGLNSGASNSDANIFVFCGETKSAYLYYSTDSSELDTSAGVDITISNPGGIRFTAAETFGFPIMVQEFEIDQRWGNFFGPAADVSDNSITGLNASSVLKGTGILNKNRGPVFLDAGYDPMANAFLFARIDFESFGCTPTTSLIVTPSSVGMVHDGMIVKPTFAEIMIFQPLGCICMFPLGDINQSCLVDLEDVSLMINLLASGQFQTEADMNQDGNLDLLDIGLFVEAVLNGDTCL